MAVFAKGLGHDEVPDNKEHEEGKDEQERKPEQMSCIFEKAHRINFPSTMAAARRNWYGKQQQGH
jgi:hypothetical protein